jgi:hypothetical protein
MDIQTETFKEQPKLITSPVNLIWASIGLGSLLALADKVAGNVSADHYHVKHCALRHYLHFSIQN